MKYGLMAFGACMLFVSGMVSASDDKIQSMIDMKLAHLETLQEKISAEEFLSVDEKEACLRDIRQQIAFYQRQKQSDTANLEELQRYASKNDPRNKRCVDNALQKRLESIRQKQDRLKKRWGRWSWIFD